MYRYVIAVEGTREAERRSIKLLLDRDGEVGYWHHLTTIWLVNDFGERNARWWHETIKRRAPSANVVVLRVTAAGWSASGPRKMFPWLRKNWTRD